MDFSKVTSIQIPEGNVTKIQDKEGNILWDNLNKYAYGIRWDSVNQATTTCERIGNLELHKTLPIQSRFKVCIHKGKEIQYYCNPYDSRFRENPTILSKGDFVFEPCDGLPSGIVCCDENGTVSYKIINDIFADYKYLYAYIYIRSNDVNCVARIVHIDVENKTAYFNDANQQHSTYASTDADIAFIISQGVEYSVELGTVLNGYDGEIGVDTGGKFYQWSVDNEGNGNEVWISEYKCVSYAKEVKRHIIGCSRACVLNTAFNDTKWGWIGSLQANTAVNVINYHQNLRGGSNDSQWDKYLGIDNFRCQLNKGRTNIPLATMRTCTQKLPNHQVLYKQLWEAIVWCWCIEYAQLDVKQTFNSALTTDGYHQGGLGAGYSVGGITLNRYNNNECFTPCDYTLHLGNNTDIKTRESKSFTNGKVTENQTSWNVPHWRGFNGFWYGDTTLNIENFLSKYNSTKQRTIYYWTDDVTKFDNTIDNKERSIEDVVLPQSNFVKEFNLGKQGNLTPRSYGDGKNVYYLANRNDGIYTTLVGGSVDTGSICGLGSIFSTSLASDYDFSFGFVTCTIID